MMEEEREIETAEEETETGTDEPTLDALLDEEDAFDNESFDDKDDL